jgi:hypothetical protein
VAGEQADDTQAPDESSPAAPASRMPPAPPLARFGAEWNSTIRTKSRGFKVLGRLRAPDARFGAFGGKPDANLHGNPAQTP